MERRPNSFRGKIFLSASLILFGLAIPSGSGSLFPTDQDRYQRHGTPMHKVQLTQKGYIQFLRWELPVPELKEFTFCLWLESSDLTRAHPIFSYSKNERERLIRAWISPRGRSIHLEIAGTEVFASPTNIHENRWYHVCQSWENHSGLYGLWINGQLWVKGRSEETVGKLIPSGGDVVLGQEYTDFDKGLEDGIEGSVLGFNLLLSSAFGPPASGYSRNSVRDTVSLPSSFGYVRLPLIAGIPTRITQPGVNYGPRTIHELLSAYSQRIRRYRGVETLEPKTSLKTVDPRLEAERSETFAELEKQPLGLQLVKLSYARCEIGRGSPFVGGPLMLISWTRTPVRVFGGATLKNVESDCGNF